MTKSFAIFGRFSYERPLFHHPDSAGKNIVDLNVNFVSENEALMNIVRNLLKTGIGHLGLEIHRVPKQLEGSVKIGTLPEKKLDFSRIELIRSSRAEDLRNESYVIDLLLELGINDERLDEFPEHLYPHTGKGVHFWQYPNQFANFLVEISKYNICSYAEIGVRHGGTFVIMYEYLKQFNPKFECAMGVDINESIELTTFARARDDIDYLLMSSRSDKFRSKIKNMQFDLAFIDGDHSLVGCKSDFELLKNQSKMLAFHDISSTDWPGVCAVWQHFKSVHKEEWDFIEFIDQYPDVYTRTGNSHLGIGLAIKKHVS